MAKISFTIVSGNQNKLKEYASILTTHTISYDSIVLDLDEIQNFDPKLIVEHKARQAYDFVGKPVVVEDISAGLAKFEGLPGPFIKFFEQKLGKGALYTLAGSVDSDAIITCTIGYFDGTTMLFAEVKQRGKVVSPRGVNGWGFDFVFMPEGYNQTFAEMEPAGKALVSHRSMAIEDLLTKLKQL